MRVEKTVRNWSWSNSDKVDLPDSQLRIIWLCRCWDDPVVLKWGGCPGLRTELVSDQNNILFYKQFSINKRWDPDKTNLIPLVRMKQSLPNLEFFCPNNESRDGDWPWRNLNKVYIGLWEKETDTVTLGHWDTPILWTGHWPLLRNNHRNKPRLGI